ncbi:MAG: 50S ribosome-binding GTPase [Conchiformibius sp.]|nr:50S ribosome-binding GTPase [Conchiformibius sp.]
MSIRAETLFQAYDKTADFVQANQFETTAFQAIQTMFEDKRQKADAHIMVYGVYNAGKSTLINALLGQEQAEIDDVPKTDSVTAYRWGQYDILDTPGVDAPIEHQKITDGEMLKADAVIFVVNPVGAAEEKNTLSKLLELVQARKQVFLVFNEKQTLEMEDFQRLKDQTQQRLQDLAAAKGLNNVLKDIPIVRVNAKSAFKGKTENKSKLLEKSGFPEFEKRLNEFLQSISLNHIYGRLKTVLVTFLADGLQSLQTRSQANMVKKYDDLLKNIENNKNQVRRNVRQAIGNERGSIERNVANQLRKSVFDGQQSAQGDTDSQIQQAFQYGAEKVSDVLQMEMSALVQQLQLDIDDLQAQIPQNQIAVESVNLSDLNYGNVQAAVDGSQLGAQSVSQISPDVVAAAVGQLSQIAKPEHIVKSLQLVKEYIPSLMKGVGIKTMEKWAGALMSKLPYVGLVISGLFALKDILGGDSEAAQMQQQIEEQNRQRERAMQQIADAARDVASQFENIMREQTEKTIEETFANIMQQVHALRQGFSDSERKNSEWIEQLSQYHALAENA